MSVNPSTRASFDGSVEAATETPFVEVDRPPLPPMSTLGAGPQPTGFANDWIPQTDIISNEDAYLIQVELPGVLTDQISVELHKDILCFTVQKKSPALSDPISIYRKERVFGFASRSFRIPTDARESPPRWTLDNGVLTIHIDRGLPLRIPLKGTKESLVQNESKQLPGQQSAPLGISDTPKSTTKPL